MHFAPGGSNKRGEMKPGCISDDRAHLELCFVTRVQKQGYCLPASFWTVTGNAKHLWEEVEASRSKEHRRVLRD